MVPIAVFLVIGGLLVWQVFALIATNRWAQHSDRVIVETSLIQNEVLDMETSMRGFAITGDPSFLEPYERARPRVISDVGEFKALVADNPPQRARMQQVERELQAWFPYSEKVIQTKRAGGDPSVLIAGGDGKKLIDAVRVQVRDILQRENALRTARLDSARNSAARTLVIAFGGLLVFGVVLVRGSAVRHKQEAMLRFTEQQFKLMVESTTDYAIFRLDDGGYIRSWNPGAQRLKGWTPEEAIGQHFSLFYVPEDRERGHPAHELEIARATGKYEEEGWRVRKDGSRFWASVSITALTRENERIGFTKITRDLTERKRAEDALRSARDTLEIRVRERTAELERAVKSREDVIAVVSHDLRNPLAAIQLSTRMLQRDVKGLPREDALASTVDRIMRAAQRMETLIRDILDVTRIGAGTLTLDRQPQDVAALAMDAVELFEAAAQRKQVTLELDLVPGAEIADVDSERIHQLFSNLLGNAIKFTPSGGRVTIGGEVRGRELVLWVADTGPGVRPDDRERIFSRYWQARGGQGQGVGLGLAIAKGIVDAHGGRIWVESEPSGGARFLFTLPARNAPSSPRADAPPPANG